VTIANVRGMQEKFDEIQEAVRILRQMEGAK
jgi:hypothetical protein